MTFQKQKYNDSIKEFLKTSQQVTLASVLLLRKFKNYRGTPDTLKQSELEYISWDSSTQHVAPFYRILTGGFCPFGIKVIYFRFCMR